MSSAETIIFESAPAGHINPRRMIDAQNRLANAAGGVTVDAQVSAAKSADEIGRLAGTLFSDEGWNAPVLKLATFTP